MSLVELQCHGEVSVVTLNRPECLNAISLRLLRELRAALQAAQDDATTRAIVLSGAGRAFCAGADLKQAAPPGMALETERQAAMACFANPETARRIAVFSSAATN